MLEWTTAVGDEDDPAVALLYPTGETRHAWKPIPTYWRVISTTSYPRY